MITGTVANSEGGSITGLECTQCSGAGTFRLEPEPGYEVLAPGSGSSLAEIEQILDAILLFSSNVDKRQIKKQML